MRVHHGVESLVVECLLYDGGGLGLEDSSDQPLTCLVGDLSVLIAGGGPSDDGLCLLVPHVESDPLALEQVLQLLHGFRQLDIEAVASFDVLYRHK